MTTLQPNPSLERTRGMLVLDIQINGMQIIDPNWANKQ